jgi:hypothetical protein
MSSFTYQIDAFIFTIQRTCEKFGDELAGHHIALVCTRWGNSYCKGQHLSHHGYFHLCTGKLCGGVCDLTFKERILLKKYNKYTLPFRRLLNSSKYNWKFKICGGES